MDEQLRKLKRNALNDPDAKDHYIAHLERLAGISRDELKIWVAEFLPERGVNDELGFVVATCLTKKQAEQEVAVMLIRMVKDSIYPRGDDAPGLLPVEEWDGYDRGQHDFLENLRSLFDQENYQQVIDLYLEEWSHHTEDVRVYEATLT
jgi:hypothetical protein